MISFRQSFKNQSEQQFVSTKQLKKDSSSYLTVEALEFICSSIKKNYSINQFALIIRQYVLQHNCIDLKHRLINFFLNVQNKLATKSDSQWNKAITFQLNILRGVKCFQELIRKMTVRKGFNKITNRQYIDRIQVEPIQEQTVPTITDQQLNSIEVTQNVKLKTRYFFKWTQFLDNTRNLNRIRIKQIDDLRKSLTFNIYAVKFSYFVNWKKITKKTIQNRQNFLIIQTAKNKRLFQYSMKGFYTMFEISKIQNILALKAQDILNNQRKTTFLQKLKQNQQLQKAKQVKNISNNKLAYKFMSFITAQIAPIQSKTLSNNNINITKHFLQIYRNQAFYILKRHLQQKKVKYNEVVSSIKKAFIQTLCVNIQKYQSQKINKYKLKEFLKTKRAMHTITILSIKTKSKLSVEQSRADEAKIAEQSSTYKKIMIQLEGNRQNKLNYDLVCAHIKSQLSKKVITKMKLQLLKRRTQSFNIHNIQKELCLKFIVQLKRLQAQKNKNKQREEGYIKRYQLVLLQNVFASIKNWKHYQLDQKQNFTKFFDIIEKKKISVSFQRIKSLSNIKRSLLIIYSKTSKLVLKNVWDICFEREIKVVKSVNAMIQRKRLSLQRKLFQVLQKNVQHINNCKQNIQNLNLSNSKTKFVNCLEKIYNLSQKSESTSIYIAQSQVKQFFGKLTNRKIYLEEMNSKFIQVQKYHNFKSLQNKINQNKLRDHQILIKKNTILNNQLKFLFKSLVKEHKKFKIQNQCLTNKSKILLIFIMRSYLSSMKISASHFKQKSNTILKQKQLKISKIRKSQFVNELTIKKNLDEFQKYLESNQKKYVFKMLMDIKRQNQNQYKLQRCLLHLFKTHNLNSFVQILKTQKQNIQINTELIVKHRINNCLKKLIENKQQKRIIKQTQLSYQSLKYRKTLKCLSVLMKNCLINKFDKVKHMCSVKNYAKNLKKKAFRGMKQMLLNIRQKQNMFRSQEQSIKKVERSFSKIKKQSTLTETINKFNIRHSRQIR